MTWSPVRTHDKTSKEPVLVALVRDGKAWRVSEATHNGFGFYDVGGYACHWATHWMPMPKVGYVPEHTGTPAEPDESPVPKEKEYRAALNNIRLSAARGRSFGHQVTPQTLETMVAKKDAALDLVLQFCERAGVAGSILRDEYTEGAATAPLATTSATDSMGNDLLVIVNPHEFRCPHCQKPIGDKIGVGVHAKSPSPQQHGPADHQAGEHPEASRPDRAEAGHPAGEARGCILNLDSPSYPPTLDEYRQCGCPDCLQKLTRINY